MTMRVYDEQLPYCHGPYDYEEVPSRKNLAARWRIIDAKGDPVGHAGTKEDADLLARYLTDWH
jgi:hypothetical protein